MRACVHRREGERWEEWMRRDRKIMKIGGKWMGLEYIIMNEVTQA